MGRSSKAFASAVALAVLFGGVGPAAAAPSARPAHPPVGAERHNVNARFVPGQVARGHGVDGSRRRAPGALGWREGRHDYGFGFAGAAIYAPPPDDAGLDAGGPPETPTGLAPRPRPCVGPLIITVTKPLPRDARAPSVIYGAPGCVTPTYRPVPSNWPRF